MKFFIWLNGEPETEVERAIKVLTKKKHNLAHAIAPTETLATANHIMIGTLHSKSLFRRKSKFDYYDVKFSKAGSEAMISKNGSVDFFFASEEEVKQLRESIINHFK